MRTTLLSTCCIFLLLALDSCYRCYECKVVTEDFGEVTRDVCGRKKDVASLIQELESDTVGSGPWVCE